MMMTYIKGNAIPNAKQYELYRVANESDVGYERVGTQYIGKQSDVSYGYPNNTGELVDGQAIGWKRTEFIHAKALADLDGACVRLTSDSDNINNYVAAFYTDKDATTFVGGLTYNDLIQMVGTKASDMQWYADSVHAKYVVFASRWQDTESIWVNLTDSIFFCLNEYPYTLSEGTHTLVVKAIGEGDVDTDGDGIITIDSDYSNALTYTVEAAQPDYEEETNEYGTTVVVSSYAEEPNEYGTTVVVGGESSEEEPEIPVWNGSDLTGTTWTVDSGWMATAGYGAFDVSTEITQSANTYNNTSNINIGYEISATAQEPIASATANRIFFWNSNGGMTTLDDTQSFEVTIISGADATNTSLISWLKQYGELTSHTMPTPIIGTFTRQYTGSSTASKTYEFEIGMTWEQWVGSEYADSNWLIYDNIVYVNAGAGRSPLKYNNVNVAPTDGISNGATYTALYTTASGSN